MPNPPPGADPLLLVFFPKFFIIKFIVTENREFYMAEKKTVKERATAMHNRAGKHGNGFVDFIRTQVVVGLAVGSAIGTAAVDTVKKLVDGFINPIIQFIVGSQDALNSAVWRVELLGRSADFAWGPFVSSAITLVVTALVIYMIINFLKLDKLDKKKD